MKNTQNREDFYNLYSSYNDILQFIQNLGNTTIYDMYKDLFPEDANKEFPEKEKPLYHLSTDKLVLFFSHSKNVRLIRDIKKRFLIKVGNQKLKSSDMHFATKRPADALCLNPNSFLAFILQIFSRKPNSKINKSFKLQFVLI